MSMGILTGVTPTTFFSSNGKIWRKFRTGRGTCSHPATVCGIAPHQTKPHSIIRGRRDNTSSSSSSSSFRFLSSAFSELREFGFRKGLGSRDWAVKGVSSDDHQSRGGGDSGGGSNSSRRGTGGNDDGHHQSSTEEGSQWWWCWLLFKEWVLPFFLRSQNFQGKSNNCINFGSGGIDWDFCCSKFAVMLVDMALCGAVPLPVVGIAGAVGILTMEFLKVLNGGLVTCLVACGIALVTAAGGLGWLVWKLTRGQEEEGGDDKTAQEEEEYCLDAEG